MTLLDFSKQAYTVTVKVTLWDVSNQAYTVTVSVTVKVTLWDYINQAYTVIVTVRETLWDFSNKTYTVTLKVNPTWTPLNLKCDQYNTHKLTKQKNALSSSKTLNFSWCCG